MIVNKPQVPMKNSQGAFFPLTSIDQVLSKDGKTRINDISWGGCIDLLWENADPLTAFAAQNLFIPKLMDYDLVYISCTGSNTSLVFQAIQSANFFVIPRIFGKSYDGILKEVANASWTTTSNSRKFSIFNDRIYFYGGYSNTTASNVTMIPYKIFGIKLANFNYAMPELKELRGSYIINLPANKWIADNEAGGYKQDVIIEGMNSNWYADIPSLVPDPDSATASDSYFLLTQDLECITSIVTSDNKITFKCYINKPVRDLKLFVPGMLAKEIEEV